MTDSPKEPTGPVACRSGCSPAVDSLPGLARVAASAALHTTEWSVKTSAQAWLRVGRALTSREEAALLVRDAGDGVAVFGELARSVSSGVPMAKALLSAGETLGGLVEAPSIVNGQVLGGRDQDKSLRELGQELLERSRDVWNTDRGHPAYGRILERARPRRGADPAAAAQGRPAAQRRRAHRRADRDGQQPPDRARAQHGRRPSRLPVPRPGAVLPQQPVPARPDLVLAGVAARPAWSTRSSRPSPTCSRRCTR